MKKPWYAIASLLLLFPLLLAACSGDTDVDNGYGQPSNATGQAAAATQAGQATQGTQPLNPLATGAAATGVSAPAQAATSVVATPTAVPPTQAAATQALATQVGAAPGIPATPQSTANAAAATQVAPVVGQAVEQRPYLASNLLDMPVWNTLEGKVASVGGLVLDSATGNVQYALVDSDGLHPVPFSMFKVVDTDPTNNANNANDNLGDLALLLPISKSQLQTAPTIADDDLKAPVVSGWAPGIQNYWAQYGAALPVTGKEAGQTAGAPVFIRDNGLFGGLSYDVENYQNNNLGTINNFVVNPDGTINYALMQTSGFLNIGAKRLLVPLRAMVYNPNNQRFLLPVDDQWLDQATTQAGLPDDAGPEFFWREDWHAGPDAFWQSFQPIQPQPGQVTPGVPTPVVPATPGAVAATPKDAMFSTARINSVDVVAPNGEALGSVSNLAFAGDRLAYVIMKVSQGYAAVPWRAFQWDQANKRLIYVQNINWLAGAPVIGSADVFESNDYAWEAPAFDYWKGTMGDLGGTVRFDKNAAALYFNRLDRIALVDAAGVNLGSVSDVIVDGQGQVRYLVVNRNGRLIPIPYKLFTWDPQNNSLVFKGAVPRLDGAPSFNNLDEVNLFDPTWDDQAEAFWR